MRASRAARILEHIFAVICKTTTSNRQICGFDDNASGTNVNLVLKPGVISFTFRTHANIVRRERDGIIAKKCCSLR